MNDACAEKYNTLIFNEFDLSRARNETLSFVNEAACALGFIVLRVVCFCSK